MKKLILFFFVAFLATNALYAQSTTAQTTSSTECAKIKTEIAGIDEDIKAYQADFHKASSSKAKEFALKSIKEARAQRGVLSKKLKDLKCS